MCPIINFDIFQMIIDRTIFTWKHRSNRETITLSLKGACIFSRQRSYRVRPKKSIHPKMWLHMFTVSFVHQNILKHTNNVIPMRKLTYRSSLRLILFFYFRDVPIYGLRGLYSVKCQPFQAEFRAQAIAVSPQYVRIVLEELRRIFETQQLPHLLFLFGRNSFLGRRIIADLSPEEETRLTFSEDEVASKNEPQGYSGLHGILYLSFGLLLCCG